MKQTGVVVSLEQHRRERRQQAKRRENDRRFTELERERRRQRQNRAIAREVAGENLPGLLGDAD